MKINKIYYLIHSLIYEDIEKNDPSAIAAGNHQIYLRREQQCKQRWLDGIERLEDDAVFAQLYGGRSIFAHAQKVLGEDRAIWVSADYDPAMDGEVYRLSLTDAFQRELERGGHSIDPDTTQLELWGESFEGCVCGYGTALGRHLDLKDVPFNRFDMTVPDGCFLCNAELVDQFLLGDSDVRAFVFDTPLDVPVGYLMDGRRWTDRPAPRVRLPVDPTKVQVVSNAGITLYANIHVSRPDREIPVKPVRAHEGIEADGDALTIDLGGGGHILATHMGMEAFRDQMKGAVVV